jgi:hypothetical protein
MSKEAPGPPILVAYIVGHSAGYYCLDPYLPSLLPLALAVIPGFLLARIVMIIFKNLNYL